MCSVFFRILIILLKKNTHLQLVLKLKVYINNLRTEILTRTIIKKPYDSELKLNVSESQTLESKETYILVSRTVLKLTLLAVPGENQKLRLLDIWD